jgi:DNA-directed RNA polymerase subunit alpha
VGEILKRMEKGEEEMLAIRNFGKKSLDELVDKLREKNYLNVPGVDLSAFFKNGGYTPGVDDEDEEDELVAEEEA